MKHEKKIIIRVDEVNRNEKEILKAKMKVAEEILVLAKVIKYGRMRLTLYSNVQ